MLFLLFDKMPTTDRNYMSALWGKLASEILMQNWDNAIDDLHRLREILDSNVRQVNMLLRNLLFS